MIVSKEGNNLIIKFFFSLPSILSHFPFLQTVHYLLPVMSHPHLLNFLPRQLVHY